MIEYRDVHKTYDAPVLTGVSLTVERGEIVSIVGASGSGKSVLLKTTNGLVAPDRGDVLVGGRSVLTARPRELEAIRRKVGYVFQYAALFDSMTIYENVAMGISAEDARALGADEVLQRVLGALESVNLDPRHVLAKLPSELSGGMRKRAGLARALVARPEVLLYDEPVTGLDPINSAVIARLIRKNAHELGVTSVVVTHDVEGALEMSTRVALLAHGLLCFVGTPDEFRRSDAPLVRAFAHREAAAEASVRMLEEL